MTESIDFVLAGWSGRYPRIVHITVWRLFSVCSESHNGRMLAARHERVNSRTEVQREMLRAKKLARREAFIWRGVTYWHSDGDTKKRI